MDLTAVWLGVVSAYLGAGGAVILCAALGTAGFNATFLIFLDAETKYIYELFIYSYKYIYINIYIYIFIPGPVGFLTLVEVLVCTTGYGAFFYYYLTILINFF